MSQDLVPTDRRRRSDTLQDLILAHVEDDNNNFAEIGRQLSEIKDLVRETKTSVADSVAFFGHAKWFVKLVTVVGGAIVALVTIVYMLHEIARAQSDDSPRVVGPSHITSSAEAGHR